MVVKKGKWYQLTPKEQEMIEERWLKLMKTKEIPKMTATEFWNNLGEKYYTKLKKNACKRIDKVWLTKQNRYGANGKPLKKK